MNESAGMRRGARLLIVDDEVALMQALCNTLEQQGYETQGASSAQAALDQLAHAHFDLLLTDLMMPVLDGLELARAAQQHDPQIAVVMMTGEGSVAGAVQAMQAGALDYVAKPFKLGTMLPVLERALALRRLRAENTALQERVQAHARELERANAELEAYAYTVSHDLRAPLRSLDGLTQRLAAALPQPASPEVRRLMELIERSARQSQQLVTDLLRLSRVSRQPLQRIRVDMHALARSVIAELRAEHRQRPLTISVDAGLPVADADAGLLRQVLVNLLANAWKFSHEQSQPSVEIGWLPYEGGGAYFVRDNGVGFDMRNADKLFEPFERLDGARGFEGTGVGLSIAQRIVQRHGGRLWAEAEPGRGACFYFTLG